MGRMSLWSVLMIIERNKCHKTQNYYWKVVTILNDFSCEELTHLHPYFAETFPFVCT